MQSKETVDILVRLQSMRAQEQADVYRCCDYLSKIRIFLSSESSLTASSPIDENFRREVVYWVYQVIDYLNLRRDTVENCVRFIDLFLSSSNSVAQEFLHSRMSFQLLSITCLYLAIKLNEPKPLDSTYLLPLARGMFVKEDILKMEALVLQILDWRVLFPTAAQYLELLHRYVELQLYDMNHADAIRFIFNDAGHQIELGIVEYALAREMPSTLALAAVQNACNRVPFSLYSHFDHRQFMKVISQVAVLLQPADSLIQVQGRLGVCIMKNSLESSAHIVPFTDWELSKKPRTPSPVSVVFRGPL